MKKHDFFTATIQIVGFYTLSQYFLNNLPFIVDYAQDNWQVAAIILAILLVYIWIILSASRIVKVLGIGRDMESEYIHIKNLTTRKMFQITILVIGVQIIVNSIPTALFHLSEVLVSKAQNNLDGSHITSFNWTRFLEGMLQLALGLLLISKSTWILNLFQKKVNQLEE